MRRLRGLEDGFTLVELALVTVLIGILAGIALPLLLGNRTRAYDTAAKSDLRNLTTSEVAYLTNHGSYGLFSDIRADGEQLRVSPNVQVRLLHVDGANGFCLSAKHRSSNQTWVYDSASGAIKQATDCAVTVTGVTGDQLSG